MIKINRTQKPAILVRNEKKWLEEYKKALADYQNDPCQANKKKRDSAEKKYNCTEVKNALVSMFSGKCAYCESDVLSVSYGEIEHFRPKSKFPDSCFDWNNLLLSCSVCNNKSHKGDLFPDSNDGGPFVNPAEENPEEFFRFDYDYETGTANILPKNIRGKTTEKELGLNRTELVRRRSAIVTKMPVIAIMAGKGDVKCKTEILKYCGEAEEYSAFARSLAKHFNCL